MGSTCTTLEDNGGISDFLSFSFPIFFLGLDLISYLIGGVLNFASEFMLLIPAFSKSDIFLYNNSES